MSRSGGLDRGRRRALAIAPIFLVIMFMAAAAVLSYEDGEVKSNRFGNGAEWAAAFGTVGAILVALFTRIERIESREYFAEARLARRRRVRIALAAVDRCDAALVRLNGFAPDADDTGAKTYAAIAEELLEWLGDFSAELEPTQLAGVRQQIQALRAQPVEPQSAADLERVQQVAAELERAVEAVKIDLLVLAEGS